MKPYSQRIRFEAMGELPHEKVGQFLGGLAKLVNPSPNPDVKRPFRNYHVSTIGDEMPVTVVNVPSASLYRAKGTETISFGGGYGSSYPHLDGWNLYHDLNDLNAFAGKYGFKVIPYD